MKTSFLIISALLAAGSVQAQFKGKMAFSGSGEKKLDYTVYSDNSQYRYEFSESGQEMVVIVKPESGQTLILMPELKTYLKTSTKDFRSLMNDPVQSAQYFDMTMEEKTVGREQMNGYECNKKEYYSKDYDSPILIYTVWFSEELNMPVKIIDHVRERNYMELTDVEKWDPVPSYFEVPDGYGEMNTGKAPR